MLFLEGTSNLALDTGKNNNHYPTLVCHRNLGWGVGQWKNQVITPTGLNISPTDGVLQRKQHVKENNLTKADQPLVKADVFFNVLLLLHNGQLEIKPSFWQCCPQIWMTKDFFLLNNINGVYGNFILKVDESVKLFDVNLQRNLNSILLY